ncbi:MAG: ABC transporter permease [Bacteroidia bacterium]
MNKREEDWTLVVRPQNKLLQLNLRELWHYRDLVILFVRRDFVSYYKQTILGPLWYIIQPVLTAIMYSFVFGTIANIDTPGLPKFLFYLSSITMWNYFAETLNKTSNTFIANAQIFGKVYFPRLTVPLSIVISSLIAFLIQLAVFVTVLLYYNFAGTPLHPNIYLLLLPLLVLVMAGIGLGAGMIISSLTTKYRDLRFLITFGVQLLMFATPVIYPLSAVMGKKKLLLIANPLSSVIETFRYGFTGVGEFHWGYLLYSVVFMVAVVAAGSVLFNKVEKSFMDTV